MELLILGFLLGLAVSPVIRSWVVWREHRDASREAWLAEQTLRRLQRDRQPDGEPPDEARSRHLAEAWLPSEQS